MPHPTRTRTPWLSRLFGRGSRKPIRFSTRPSLGIEYLEDRVVPANLTQIDFGGLRFVVNSGGSFEQSGNDYEALAANVSIGYTPAGTENFYPLLNVVPRGGGDSRFAVDTTPGAALFVLQRSDLYLVAASGGGSVDPPIPIWQPSTAFPMGFPISEVLGSGFSFPTPNSFTEPFTVASVDFLLDGFLFSNPNGGDTSDAQVKMQGTASFDKVPIVQDMGVTVKVDNDNYVVADHTGITLTGLNVDVPISGKVLSSIGMKLTGDLNFGYTQPNNEFSISGGVQLTTTDGDSGGAVGGANATLNNVAAAIDLRFSNGTVSKLGFGVSGQFEVRSLTVSVPANQPVTFDYDFQQQQFELSGLLQLETADVNLTIDLQNSGGPGIVIKDGKLVSFDGAVRGTVQFAKATLSTTGNDGLEFKYDSSTDEFSIAGGLQLQIPTGNTSQLISASLTDQDGGPGLILKDGSLQKLYLDVTGGFDLFGLKVNLQDASVSYVPATDTTPSALGFGGTISLDFGVFQSNLTLGTGTDQGLLIENGKFSVKSINWTLEKIELGEAVTINEVQIAYKEDGTSYDLTAVANVTIAGKITVDAEFDVVEGKLDTILVDVSVSPGVIEIGDTGLSIVDMHVKITILADPPNIVATGGLAVVWGDAISLPTPGNPQGYLFRAEGDVTASARELVIDCQVLLGAYTTDNETTWRSAMGSGDGKLTLDWADGYYAVHVEMDGVMGVFDIEGDLVFAKGKDVALLAEATVVIPGWVPFIGGDTIGGFGFFFEHNFLQKTTTFAAWIDLDIIWKFTVGFELVIGDDGGISTGLIGASQVAQFQADVLPPADKTYTYSFTPQYGTGAGQVPPTATSLVISADWTKSAAGVTLLGRPKFRVQKVKDGQTTTYTEDQFAANGISFISDAKFNGPTTAAVQIVGSTASPYDVLDGQYSLLVDFDADGGPPFPDYGTSGGDDQLVIQSTYHIPTPVFGAKDSTAPYVPQLPAAPPQGAFPVTLQGNVDSGLLGQTRVTLYRIDQSDPFKRGVLIGTAAPTAVTSPDGSVNWQAAFDVDVNGLYPTPYALYAIVNDGFNAPVATAVSASFTPDFAVQGKVANQKNDPKAAWNVFLDYNGNGVRDPNEPATQTNAGGFYSFTRTFADQPPVPLVLTGFNQDVVFERGANPTVSQSFDNSGFAWFQAGATDAAGATHPDGLASSFTSPFGAPFRFQSFAANNVLLLGPGGGLPNRGTLTLASPGVYTKLSILASASSPASPTGTLTVHYADGTADTFNFNAPDWGGSGGPTAALPSPVRRAQVGAANTFLRTDPNSGPQWGMFETDITPNPNKVVASLEFVASGPNSTGIFAVSGVADTAPVPVNKAFGVVLTPSAPGNFAPVTTPVVQFTGTTLDVPFALTEKSAIKGTVFLDRDGNGQITGSSPAAGAVVFIDANNNGRRDPTDPSTLADSAGRYSFPNIAPGNYTVLIDTPSLGRTTPAEAAAVPAGTTGNETDNYNYGLAFTVNQPVQVTSLGAFDSGGDGFTGTITVTLYDADAKVGLAQLTFTPSDPGTLTGGTRYKSLATPLTLPPGFRGIIAASGFGPSDPAGNVNSLPAGTTPAWTLDNGNGRLTFRTGVYSTSPTALPTTPDPSGLANPYAAGSFLYADHEWSQTSPATPPVAAYQATGVGTPFIATTYGMDFVVNRPIEITTLGVFSSLAAQQVKSNLTAYLYNTATQQVVAQLDFTPDDSGTLVGSSLYKRLPQPVFLPAGFQGTIVVYGYGLLQWVGGEFADMSTDGGDGSISFVGTGRMAPEGTQGTFPPAAGYSTPDPFGAGTFQFSEVAGGYNVTVDDTGTDLQEGNNFGVLPPSFVTGKLVGRPYGDGGTPPPPVPMPGRTVNLLLASETTGIDAGGTGSGSVYKADGGFAGGTTRTTTTDIETSGVSDPAPEAVYQTAREGTDSGFTYTVGDLAPGGAYVVRLHFAEIVELGPGQRVFDVLVNGLTALNDFDIFAAAGAQNTAVVRELNVFADSNGKLTLSFRNGPAGVPLVNGIEVLQPGTVVATTRTDASGRYTFGPLLPGQYTVEQVVPAGWRQASPFHSPLTLTSTVLNDNGQQSLPPFTSYNAFASADFNGDGYVDFALTSGTSATQAFPVQVYYNQKNGTVTQPYGFANPVAGGILTVAGDFNGDHLPDVAVLNPDPGTPLSVYLNTGSADPAARFQLAPGFWPYSLPADSQGTVPADLEAGDFNGDGLDDLVLSYTQPGANAAAVALLLGAAEPSGRKVNTYPLPTGGSSGQVQAGGMAIGDLNGDGKQDVIVNGGNSAAGAFNVGFGDGAGNLSPWSQYAGPDTLNGGPVTLSDVRGVGSPDALLLTVDSTARTYRVTDAQNRGDGVLDVRGHAVDSQTFDLNPAPVAIDLRDLNGDLRPDLVMLFASKHTQALSDQLVVFLNTGSAPYFDPAQGKAFIPEYDGGYVNPAGMAIVDINNDGLLDVLLSNAVDGQGIYGVYGSVFLNQSSESEPGIPVSVAAGQTLAGNDFANVQLPTQGAVHGRVFEDANRNGRWEVGETGGHGTRVFADLNRNGRLDPGEPTAVTGAGGFYAITGLRDGGYAVGLVPRNDWKASAPANEFTEVTIANGSPVQADFGRVRRLLGGLAPQTVRVGGTLDVTLPPASAAADRRLVYSLEGDAPAGLGIEPATGRLTWSPTAADAGLHTVAVRVRDPFDTLATDTRDVTIKVTTSPVPMPLTAVGGAGRVRVFAPDGTPRLTLTPYGPGFRGSVRVAVGDVNGDGVDDVVTAAGPGGGPRVKVFDGATGARIVSEVVLQPSPRGGLFVAAGDIDGDGFADLIVGTGAGVAPRVRVLSGKDLDALGDYTAFGQAFRNGVRVAAGDVTGDGYADVIAAAGPGGQPRVKVFDGGTGDLVAGFLAYGPGSAGGVFVSAGDIDGNGLVDVVTSRGAGLPRVRAFGGERVATGTPGVPVADIQVGPAASRVVAAAKPAGDGRPAALVVGDGDRGRVKAYRLPVVGGEPPAVLFDLDVFPTSSGVFVG